MAMKKIILLKAGPSGAPVAGFNDAPQDPPQPDPVLDAAREFVLRLSRAGVRPLPPVRPLGAAAPDSLLRPLPDMALGVTVFTRKNTATAKTLIKEMMDPTKEGGRALPVTVFVEFNDQPSTTSEPLMEVVFKETPGFKIEVETPKAAEAAPSLSNPKTIEQARTVVQEAQQGRTAVGSLGVAGAGVSIANSTDMRGRNRQRGHKSRVAGFEHPQPEEDQGSDQGLDQGPDLLVGEVPRVAPHPGGPLPKGFRQGRMRATLVINGGQKAMLDVLEGLVKRNMRALQRGVKGLDPRKTHYVEETTWRDLPAALADGVASAGTIAAWKVAEERLAGRSAGLALVHGIPMVTGVGGLQDPTQLFGRGSRVGSLPFVGSTMPHSGRVETDLILTLDDDRGTPIVDIGNEIARHNAKQIVEQGLPKLYTSGIRYRNETTERWLDAQQIYEEGFDDCEGLSAYRAGELAVEGYTAGVVARIIPGPSTEMGGTPKGRLYHAVTGVEADGGVIYDDPSARLGMPVPAFYREYAAKQRAIGKDL